MTSQFQAIAALIDKNSLPSLRSLAIRSRRSADLNGFAENGVLLILFLNTNILPKAIGKKSMPSPSAARHRDSIIRQLSLQSQPSAQTPAGRRSLKKQLSEDDGRGRSLDSVEITGQGWSVTGSKFESGLQGGSNASTKHHGKVTRPRPVKLAWADRKQDNAECPTGVEVVARKCQGQPRPLTVKAQRITNLPLPGDKDTLVYTRQELAERLRIAWKEREKNKPNLNIFLAHAADGIASSGEEPSPGRSKGVPQTEILIRDSVTFRSASESSLSCASRKIADTEPVCDATEDPVSTKEDYATDSGIDLEPKSILKNVPPEQTDNNGGETEYHGMTDSPEFRTFPVGEHSNTFGSNLTNLNYPMKSPDVLPNVGSERDKENSSPRSDPGFVGRGKIPDEEAPSKALEVNDGAAQGTAKERRASFRSGGLLNKTIDAESSDEVDEDVAEETRNEIKVILKRNEEKRPPLARTFSAPTRNDPPKQAQTSNNKMNFGYKPIPHYASSVDLAVMEEDINTIRGRIKSAPIRRKLKTATARRKQKSGKEPESSDDEKPNPDSSKTKTSRRKAGYKINAADIVTMVSLVSPATSDTEESAIAIPEETWVPEDKEEKTKGEDAGQSQPPKEISSFIIQKFVSLRKTNKTVSFVQHPPINRSYSASFPSRRAPAGTPIIIPMPVASNRALTPAQLQEREKRPQPPSPGVATSIDSRGIKRRLIRTSSVPHVKEANGLNDAGAKAEEMLEDVPKKDFDQIEESKEEDEEKKEPEFKTPKEKECWVLYQKMLEKGVSVSFDTVLRGMLTPTEYRLRKNQLLSCC